tara:strand:- start:1438 stop:3534 length:2097 start_codon:yes stop_codon:yes gene_type:complete
MSIISTGSRVDTPYDIYLEVDNQKLGFMLNDIEGILGYRASLSEQVTPQFNTASFDYASVPIEVEIPVAYENWQGGCGFNSVEYEEAQSLTKYSFTRGVDASYAGKLYAGPDVAYHQTSLASSLFFTSSYGSSRDPNPEVKFYYAPSTGYVWAFGGQFLWYFSGGTTWTQASLSFNAGYAITDIIDYNDTLFVSVMTTSTGTPVKYYYSTDNGATWTQSNLSNAEMLYFSIRGETSGSPYLWAVNANGEVRSNTNGQNGGAAWSGAIALGDALNDTVTGMIIGGNFIYVFKVNSIWRTDGSDSLCVWDNTGNAEPWYSRAGNGSRPFVWSDGNIYVQYGRRILQIDPNNNTQTIVWPPSAAQAGSEELDGRITGITGDSEWLYFSLVNDSGVSYIMKGVPGTTNFHTLTYIQYPAIKGIGVFGAGLITDTNPYLLFGTDATGIGAPSYGYLGGFRLPKVGMLPDTDPDYAFDSDYTQGQYVVGPWVDVGQAASAKLLNGARVLSTTANESSPTTISYVTDTTNYADTFLENVRKGDITGTEIGTATDDDASFRITTEVRFNKIRYILKMTRATPKNVASIDSVVLDTTIAPKRRRLFECDILIADDLPLKGGGNSRYGAKLSENFLFNASDRLITLTDIFNRTYSVKMLNLRAAGVMARDGRDLQVYTVSFAQINQLTDLGDDLVYDVSAWNTGKVYA